MFSLESPMGFFQGTQERVRNSPVKRAIGVRATEVLLYTPVTHDSDGCLNFSYLITEIKDISFFLMKGTSVKHQMHVYTI